MSMPGVISSSSSAEARGALSPPRRPARDITDAVVRNMLENLEELKYTTLAPSRFIVYLHRAEHARLEGVLSIIEEQTLRALDEALHARNHGSVLRRLLDALLLRFAAGRALHKLLGHGGQPVVQRAADWHVEFLPDPGGELENEGDILVTSDLALPAQPDLGVGERTRRFTTSHTGTRMTSTASVVNKAAAGTQPVHARLRYEDSRGAHTFDITRDSITIGRGGIAYPVDVRIESSSDVSREHLRIRRDATTGAFFVIDLSSLGTSMDGQRLPRGYTDDGGTKRENGTETRLPARASLRLADVVTMEFEASGT
jgi:hypothetical protein